MTLTRESVLLGTEKLLRPGVYASTAPEPTVALGAGAAHESHVVDVQLLRECDQPSCGARQARGLKFASIPIEFRLRGMNQGLWLGKGGPSGRL